MLRASRPIRWGALGLTVAGLAAGCFDDRERPTVPVFGDLYVNSDPRDASIVLDGRATTFTTPAVLSEVPAGDHELELGLQVGPVEFFGWAETVSVPEERLDSVDAALEGGCRTNCPFLIDRGRIRCRANGRGDTCADVFFDVAPALQWPDATGGVYGAGGRLLLAGIIGPGAGDQAGDTVTTPVYGTAWIGRRPISRTSQGRRQFLEIEYWGTSTFAGEALQGLEVKQTIMAVDSAGVEDVLFLHFEVENISRDARYRRIYPWVPEDGYTYEDLYVGFGLDADVGSSENDLGTFDADLDLGFLYDAFMQDPALGEDADRPGLVGLVSVEPPPGASARTFTIWPRSADWDDGPQHGLGWRMLAGRLTAQDGLDDHPAPEIGHVSDTPNDYRLIEAHGPLVLGPGESFSYTVALILARPVPGTYTPGVLVPAGDPEASGRQILDVAADLRALATQVPALWDRYRP